MTDIGTGTAGDPADTGALTQWAAQETEVENQGQGRPPHDQQPAGVPFQQEEEGQFRQIVEQDQGDAQRHEAVAVRPTWWGRGLGGSRSDLANTEVQMDQDEATFAGEIAKEISTGAIAPPPGGPLTPEEIHEVEMNPWPGHTMAEAVTRLRAQRAPGGDAPAGS